MRSICSIWRRCTSSKPARMRCAASSSSRCDQLEHLLLAAGADARRARAARAGVRPRAYRARRARGERLLERLLELGAHTRERGALLVALRCESVGIGDDPRLDVGEQPLLPLRELGDAGLRRLGGTVEILRPRCEALLHLRLRRRERLGQRRDDVALASANSRATLLGDLPLLLDEERDRVGARPGERPLELLGPVGGLPVDERDAVRLRCARCASILRRAQVPAAGGGDARDASAPR